MTGEHPRPDPTPTPTPTPTELASIDRDSPGKSTQVRGGRDRSRGKLAFYAVVRGLLFGLAKLLFRLRIEGTEHIPAEGPFVLAPVHRSNLDFALVSALTRRRMRYMGKDSLWRSRALGWFITALGAFPVRRGSADREALRTTLEVIRAGEPVVLFPEGTRRSGPVVESIFDGAAYVAGKAGVPIVPVGIGGSERAMPRGARMIRPVRVALVVGPPLTVEAAGGRASRSAVRATSARLKDELQRLFDRAQALVGQTG